MGKFECGLDVRCIIESVIFLSMIMVLWLWKRMPLLSGKHSGVFTDKYHDIFNTFPNGSERGKLIWQKCFIKVGSDGKPLENFDSTWFACSNNLIDCSVVCLHLSCKETSVTWPKWRQWEMYSGCIFKIALTWFACLLEKKKGRRLSREWYKHRYLFFPFHHLPWNDPMNTEIPWVWFM